jgi:hypothetical protein
MKIFLFAAAFIFSSLILLSCKKDNPVIPPVEPPPLVKDTITISLVQVTHSSIVINIKSTTNNPNSTIELYRQLNNKDTLAAGYPITVKDTTITDDNNGRDLLLNTEYKYYAVRTDSTGEKKDTSNIVTARTLAATNFNYTWQVFSIGEPGSVLYDVWGTDENNVYACGSITINDTVYGILKWDGIEWLPLKRNGGFNAIYGFSITDIWSVGGAVIYFNGTEWVDYTYKDPIINNNQSYYSVWGTSSSNLYFGSGRGKIIHWDGSSAEIVFSNPDNVYVNGLDGYSSDFIIGVGTGMIPPLLAVFYDGNRWDNLPINSDWSLNSVSIVTRKHIYFGGDGIFELKNGNFSRIFESGYYIWDIEYNKQNGITVASGDFDGVYINNGLEWRNYKGQITSDNTSYAGIYLTNNTIFCVGSTVNEAKIIIGKN